MKKITISLIIIAIIGSALFPNRNYAKVTVDEEEFIEAFWKIAKEDEENAEEIYSIDKDKNLIIIRNEGQEINIEYDFTNRAKFITKSKIIKEDGAEGYAKAYLDKLVLFIPYEVILYMNNVKRPQIAGYIMELFFGGEDYVIAEMPLGSKEINLNDENIDIIESVKESFQNSKIVTKDIGTKGYNTFLLTDELENVTEESCEIISTIEINPNANFEQINSIQNDEIENLISDEIYKKAKEAAEEYKESLKKESEMKVSDNSKIKTLPQTGKGIETADILKGSIAISVVILFALAVKDIKKAK